MFIVDAHCDSMLDVVRKRRRLGIASNNGHLDLPRLMKAGVSIQFFAFFIESIYKPHGSLRRTLQLISNFYKELESNSSQMHLITTKRDLEQHLKINDNKVGVILAIEGGEALEGDLDVLECLFRLGIRSLGLTWNQRNEIADGVGEKFSRGGLTSFGREVVKTMNRLGMVIDLAHIAEAGFWDTLELSSKPVIVSHANCRKLCEHHRNLTDTQIKALAQAQGVLGITYAAQFVATNATIEDVVEHIDHVCQLVGNCLHVGLGSDFDGADIMPKGLEDVTKVPKIIDILQKKGYKEENIAKIMGENFIRVLKENLPPNN